MCTVIETPGTLQLDNTPADGAGFTNDSGRVVGYTEVIQLLKPSSRSTSGLPRHTPGDAAPTF